MAHLEGEPLFHGNFIRDVLEGHFVRFEDVVNSIPKDQFVSSSDEDILEHVLDKLHVDSLSLYPEAMTRNETQETEVARRDYGMPVRVSALKIGISVPYSGDHQLWSISPNLFQSIFPRGRVTRPGSDGLGTLEMTIIQETNEPPEKVKELLDKTIANVCECIETQNSSIEVMTGEFKPRIKEAIDRRRKKLQVSQMLDQVINIPLKRRDGVPEIKPISIERKLPRPLPVTSGSAQVREPGISMEDFEDILALIRHVGRTFEITPKTYSVHGEEELRDILLANLNGIYKGGATGETFRRKGKTDIRIEDSDRAAFVAECKVWKGESELSEGIDQLLGYLTWRDCKASVVIFNKHNAKFSELLIKIPEMFKKHKFHIRELGQQSSGEWRYLFSSEVDRGRQITIQVFLFNLYSR